MVLVLVATALLAGAVWEPVRLRYEAWQEGRARAAHDAQVAAEQAALRAELATGRAGIIERIKGLQAKGEYASALALAGRYQPSGDAEIGALFRLSAEVESRRSRLAVYRRLIERECVESEARSQLAALLGSGTSDPPVVADSLVAVRAQAAADLALVRQRIRSDAPGLDLAGSNTQSAPDDDHGHRLRVHPQYAAALLGVEGSDPDLLCVWDVRGIRRLAGSSVPFRVKLWLAPRVDGTQLGAEALSYAQGPGDAH